MDNLELLRAIKDVLVNEYGMKAETISLKLNDSIESLGLDSFGVVQLVYELEIKMGIKIDTNSLRDVKYIKDFLELIKKGSVKV
ncbi:MAG: hypothetical protein HQL30_12110 [Candidatus Omnitrophica bacterium]|nr:hypothetical protein [Candidatus Omnitrophota bacterium]